MAKKLKTPHLSVSIETVLGLLHMSKKIEVTINREWHTLRLKGNGEIQTIYHMKHRHKKHFGITASEDDFRFAYAGCDFVIIPRQDKSADAKPAAPMSDITITLSAQQQRQLSKLLSNVYVRPDDEVKWQLTADPDDVSHYEALEFDARKLAKYIETIIKTKKPSNGKSTRIQSKNCNHDKAEH